MIKNKKGIHFELKNRNIDIYKKKYGIGKYNAHTCQELALEYNLSRARIIQICQHVAKKYGENLEKLD